MREATWKSRTSKLACILLCAFLHDSTYAKSVALIVDYGDTDGIFDKKQKELAKEFGEVYSSLGYDVRYVKPSKDAVSATAGAFDNIGSVDNLTVLTMGHGLIDPPPLDNSSRYPPLDYRPSSGTYNDDSPKSFHFHNGVMPMEISRAGIQSEDFNKAVRESEYATDVGMGDYLTWIGKVKQANPNASVNVFIEQCYGGSAARTLQTMGGVQAYSATNDREEAWSVPGDKDNPTIFFDFYLKELKDAAANPKSNVSTLNAFLSARKKWLVYYGGPETPWSSVDVFLNNWCTKNPPQKSDVSLEGRGTGTDTELTRSLKAASDDTLQIEMENAKKKQAATNCDKTLPDKERDALIAESAEGIQAALAIIRDDPKLLLGESPDPAFMQRYQASLGKTIQCLRASAFAKCALDGDFFIKLFSVKDPLNLKQNCDPLQPDKFDPRCMRSVGNLATKAPAVVLSILFLGRQELEGRKASCDSNESKRVLEYYQSCYNRFWSNATESDLRDLSQVGARSLSPVRVSPVASDGSENAVK